MVRPLGLSEKKLVPDPILFTEHDPLGALVANSVNSDKAALFRGNGSRLFS